MKNENKNKILLYISFIVVLLLILLRFGISYLKSDGFNGLSIQIPILLFCTIFLHCVPLLFLPHGYIRIAKGAATTLYYGQL